MVAVSTDSQPLSFLQSFGDLVEATTERDRVSREVAEMEAKVQLPEVSKTHVSARAC